MKRQGWQIFDVCPPEEDGVYIVTDHRGDVFPAEYDAEGEEPGTLVGRGRWSEGDAGCIGRTSTRASGFSTTRSRRGWSSRTRSRVREAAVEGGIFWDCCEIIRYGARGLCVHFSRAPSAIRSESPPVAAPFKGQTEEKAKNAQDRAGAAGRAQGGNKGP